MSDINQQMTDAHEQIDQIAPERSPETDPTFVQTEADVGTETPETQVD